MRISGFEVTVVRASDDSALPEIVTGTEVSIVAESGSEFKIKIVSLTQGHQTFMAYMEIDGKSPGVSNLVYEDSRSVYFTGFVEGTGADLSRFEMQQYTWKLGIVERAFRFADAREGTAASIAGSGSRIEGADSKVGIISIKIWRVQQNGQRRPMKHGSDPNAPDMNAAGRGKVPEGKKFFLAPSLAAEGGTRRDTGLHFSNIVYSKIGSQPSAEFVLKYDTASTLLLRRVLDPNNPRHKAIIDSSRAGGGRSARQSHAASSAHASARPSQPWSSNPAQAPSQPEIDTKPVINRKRQAALAGAAADEELVCDLTDDAAGAQWASKKRGRRNA